MMIKSYVRMSRWKLGSMVRINGLFHLLINGIYIYIGVITQVLKKRWFGNQTIKHGAGQGLPGSRKKVSSTYTLPKTKGRRECLTEKKWWERQTGAFPLGENTHW